MILSVEGNQRPEGFVLVFDMSLDNWVHRHRFTGRRQSQNLTLLFPRPIAALSMCVGLLVVCNTALATPEVDVVATAAATVRSEGGVRLATVPVRISVIPGGKTLDRCTRMVVRIRPRSSAAAILNNTDSDANASLPGGERPYRSMCHFGHVVDYAPKTQTASWHVEPATVRTTDERSDAAGMSVDGAYGGLATAHGGWDRTDKQSTMVETKRLPRLVASIASGTIDRGTAVAFKLDATPELVLEGERVFHFTCSVGDDWRGSMVDVEIELAMQTPAGSAQSFWSTVADRRGPASETIVHRHRFSVAVYRDGDAAAHADALRVVRCERSIHRSVDRLDRDRRWTDRLIDPLNLRGDRSDWAAARRRVDRVLAGTTDPHRDEVLRSLPMSFRTELLDYVDARDRLAFGATDEPATRLASMVADGSLTTKSGEAVD